MITTAHRAPSLTLAAVLVLLSVSPVAHGSVEVPRRVPPLAQPPASRGAAAAETALPCPAGGYGDVSDRTEDRVGASGCDGLEVAGTQEMGHDSDHDVSGGVGMKRRATMQVSVLLSSYRTLHGA